MKKVLFIILLSFPFWGFTPDKTIPGINQKILSYVDTVIGKQVDRGECWDFAAAALQYAGGYLDRSSQKTIYIFGKKINPKKDTIYPGDIIQFENVSLEYQKGNVVYKENMPHHTAIIYKVLGEGHYELAHQNTAFSGKKVGLSELRLSDVKKGEMIFYRPVADK